MLLVAIAACGDDPPAGGAAGASSSSGGSSSGGSSSGSSGGSSSGTIFSTEKKEGIATYYDATGDGSCSFGTSSDLDVAAFNFPEFAKSAGDAADGVYSATLWVETLPFPGAKEYFNNFQKKYGSETEYHGAEAYAAMYVVADALKRAKSISPKDVRDALAATDMKTAFGPVKFVSYGKKTQQNKLDTYMVQWQKGELEAVWPKAVATKNFIYPTPPWDKRK